MEAQNPTYADGQTRIEPKWRHAPWWIKAGAQAALSLMPFGEAINHRLQIWNGFYTNFRWAVECNIKYLCDIVRTTSRCGLPLQGARTLEVGTGWIPTVPLGMHLLGAQVHTYDHVRHLRTANLAKLVALYPEYLPTLAQSAGLDVTLLEKELRDFKAGGAPWTTGFVPLVFTTTPRVTHREVSWRMDRWTSIFRWQFWSTCPFPRSKLCCARPIGRSGRAALLTT